MANYVVVPPNEVLPLPAGVDTDAVSDGYHSFDELYEHRCRLFIALLVCINEFASLEYVPFKTLRDDQGRELAGWFIAGLDGPCGQITYHVPLAKWDSLPVRIKDRNSDYDGHTSADVLERLEALRRAWV